MYNYFLLVFPSDMDESMDSVHSTSAMDISPASSPIHLINAISSDPLLLNAFQQQQRKLLQNILLNEPNLNDYRNMNINPVSYEPDDNSKSFCRFTTVLTENNDDIIPANHMDETNRIRQRIIPEPISPIVEYIPTVEKLESKSSGKSCSKIFLFIPILMLIIYVAVQHMNKSVILPRSTNWQNASEYLSKHLVGQELPLEQFKDTMEKHKNFSIILIEVIINYYIY